MLDVRTIGRDLSLVAAGATAAAAAWWHGHTIRAVRDRTATIGPSDVVLLTRLDARTPIPIERFLGHYRGLGVDHFLVLAKGARDDLADRMAAAGDVSLWSVPAPGDNHIVHWCNDLLRRHGRGHLCLTVAPDEFLLYPHMATRSLHAVGQFLLDDRRLGMAATVIDAAGEAAAADPTRIPLVWWRRHYSYRGSTAHALPRRLERVREPNRLALTGCLFRFKVAPPSDGLPSPAELVARGLMSPGAWF